MRSGIVGGVLALLLAMAAPGTAQATDCTTVPAVAEFSNYMVTSGGFAVWSAGRTGRIAEFRCLSSRRIAGVAAWRDPA